MRLELETQKDQETQTPRAEDPERSNKGKRRILFEVEAPPGSEVFVAGNFNDWELTKHRLTDKGHPGQFRRQVYVEPGTVEYKFVVDGNWQIDSNCPHWRPNEFGTLNSVTDAS